jgi:hypothetical protein
MRGQAGVLPRSSGRDVLLTGSHAVPARESEIGVPGRMIGAFQDVWRNVSLREVSDRIATWFEEQEYMLTIGDPSASKTHAHAPAQSLDIQQFFGQWFRYEEAAHGSCRERALLPGQSHCFLPEKFDDRGSNVTLAPPT